MSLILEIKTSEKGITVEQIADKYKKKVGEMQAASSMAANKMVSAFGAVKTQYLALTAAIGGTVIGIVHAINSTAKYREEIFELSKKTGVSVETLSAMRYVTSQLGGDIGTFAMGMKGLLRNMMDVKQGSKETKKIFDELGVSVLDDNKKLRSAEDVFFDLADAIKNYGNESEQGAISQEVFGKAGLDMTLMMQAGTPVLKGYFDEAKRAGEVFTAEEAAQADAYSDAVSKLTGRLRIFKENIIGPLLPNLTKFFNVLTSDKIGRWEKLSVLFDPPMMYEYMKKLEEINKEEEKLATMKGMATMPEVTIIGHQTELDKALNTQRKSSHDQEIQRTAQQILQKEHLRRIGLDLLEIGTSQAEQFNKLFRESGAGKTMKDTFAKMQGSFRGGKMEVVGLQESIAQSNLNLDDMTSTARIMQLTFQQAGESIQANITDGLARALVYGKSLQDTMRDIFSMAMETLLETGLRAGIGAIFGGPGGALKALGYGKQGGMVPSYQSGGMIASGYSKPVPIVAHGGEGVLNSERGMRAVGGPAGLARLNAGMPSGGVNINMNISTNSLDERFLRTKMIPALKHELERSGLSLA